MYQNEVVCVSLSVSSLHFLGSCKFSYEDKLNIKFTFVKSSYKSMTPTNSCCCNSIAILRLGQRFYDKKNKKNKNRMLKMLLTVFIKIQKQEECSYRSITNCVMFILLSTFALVSQRPWSYPSWRQNHH